MTTTNPIHDLLHTTPLAEVLPALGKEKTITLKTDNTVEELVFELSDHKIISAPVINSEGKCVGMVDMLDVISHVISVAPLPCSLTRDELGSLEICGRAMALQECSKIINKSGSDPFVPVYEASPPSMLSDLFAGGAHRVPILTPEDEVVDTVSQSDLVKFLATHIHMGHCKEVGELTADTLGLGKVEVVAVDKRETVLAAMEKLKASGVSALAVIDKEEGGKLCGNFSATDLKGLFKETFPSLLLSVEDYMAKHSPASANPICARLEQTLIEIVRDLVENKVHRLWVVDEDFKPTGVISMTDIFKVVKWHHTG